MSDDKMRAIDERKHQVRAFLAQFIGDETFDDNENFFDTGLINSIVALDLLQFLEKLFSITVPTEELRIDNFANVNAVMALMAELTGDTAKNG
jgi:methoxymalonate biosynthesis acyl carrier protein